MNIIKIIGVLIFFGIGAYFMNGGWAENLGSLYRNYKESHLSLYQFWKTIIKKH